VRTVRTRVPAFRVRPGSAGAARLSAQPEPRKLDAGTLARLEPAVSQPSPARRPARAFVADYGTKWPKAAAKITDDLDVLLAFYDYPAEHLIRLRTTNPTESAFATVRLRQRVTRGPAPAPPTSLWPSSSSSPRMPLARGPGTASSPDDPTNQEAISSLRDQGGHETGRHVGQLELPVRFGCLTGWGALGGIQVCRAAGS
jgi:hypothetical protein